MTNKNIEIWKPPCRMSITFIFNHFLLLAKDVILQIFPGHSSPHLSSEFVSPPSPSIQPSPIISRTPKTGLMNPPKPLHIPPHMQKVAHTSTPPTKRPPRSNFTPRPSHSHNHNIPNSSPPSPKTKNQPQTSIPLSPKVKNTLLQAARNHTNREINKIKNNNG